MSSRDTAPKSPADQKAERLAQALRANLRRRKAAGQVAKEKPTEDDAAPFSDGAEPR